MKSISLSVIFLILSIITLLGLPYGTDLIYGIASAKTIPQNSQISQNETSQLINTPKPKLIPVSHGLPAPYFSATAVLAKDLESDLLIYAKDPDAKVPIASTTKMMTALVGVEHFQPDSVLLVPDLTGITGSNMDLIKGEKITFRSLLYGLMLNSGNDAAFTIAENFLGGREAFVFKMNEYTQKLGLENTHFDNPAGFDSPNHFSSAYDLAQITTLALKNYQLSKVVATKQTTVTSVDQKTIHKLININELLNKEGYIGVKTGFTPRAKENLIALYQKDGHTILTVVLGSDDRFGETEELISWIYTNFEWR